MRIKYFIIATTTHERNIIILFNTHIQPYVNMMVANISEKYIFNLSDGMDKRKVDWESYS